MSLLSLNEFNNLNIPELSEQTIELTEGYTMYHNAAKGCITVVLFDANDQLVERHEFDGVEVAEVFLQEHFDLEDDEVFLADPELSEALCEEEERMDELLDAIKKK